MTADNSQTPGRVFIAGATGYIGRHVVKELVQRGYEVISFARERAGINAGNNTEQTRDQLPGSEVRFGDICQPQSIIEPGLALTQVEQHHCLAHTPVMVTTRVQGQDRICPYRSLLCNRVHVSA